MTEKDAEIARLTRERDEAWEAFNTLIDDLGCTALRTRAERAEAALRDAIEAVIGRVWHMPWPGYQPQISVERVNRWRAALAQPEPLRHPDGDVMAREDCDDPATRMSADGVALCEVHYDRLCEEAAALQPEPSAPCETCGGSGLVAIGEPELLDPEVPWSLQQPCEPCPACGGGA